MRQRGMPIYLSPPRSPSARRSIHNSPTLLALKGRSMGMEDNGRRSGYTLPSGFSPRSGLSASSQYSTTSEAERYKSSSFTAQSPATPSAPGRYSYGFGSEGANLVGPSLAATGMPYSAQLSPSRPSSSRLQDPSPTSQQQTSQQQRQQQQQQQSYTTYGSTMLYGGSSQQQTGPQTSYEPVQPYQQRQSAAIEALANPFGVSQDYYGQAGVQGGQASVNPSTTSSSNMAATHLPAQYSEMAYASPEHSTGRQSLSSTGLQAAIAEAGSHAYNSYGQQNYDMAGLGDGRVLQQAQQMQEQSQQSQQFQLKPTSTVQQQPSSELLIAFDNFHTELKRTYELVRDDQIHEAGKAIMELSTWLLRNAESLGLNKDGEVPISERLQLWDLFNRAFLAVLQAQKEATTEALATGQRPKKTLLDTNALEKMGQDLTKQCDGLEKFGLVDYEMGVWEEEIITRECPVPGTYASLVGHPRRSDSRKLIKVIISCLDLLEDEQAQTVLSHLLTRESSSSSVAK